MFIQASKILYWFKSTLTKDS